jgi:hypothetical protein
MNIRPNTAAGVSAHRGPPFWTHTHLGLMVGFMVALSKEA